MFTTLRAEISSHAPPEKYEDIRDLSRYVFTILHLIATNGRYQKREKAACFAKNIDKYESELYWKGFQTSSFLSITGLNSIAHLLIVELPILNLVSCIVELRAAKLRIYLKMRVYLHFWNDLTVLLDLTDWGLISNL